MISLRADHRLIRADARTRRHIVVGIQAPEALPEKGRLPVNLAFVIDRSGSMHGAKLARACQAVVTGVKALADRDRFAVVSYDDRVDVVVPSVEATPHIRERAAKAVSAVEARGNTDLHGGWLKGCQMVKGQLEAQAVGRCLLLTDGLANRGETDTEEIVRQCASWRDLGVVTSAFGVGADFDERLLRRIADAGGGNFHFIESAVQIGDFISSEVGETLTTNVREGVLVVDAGEDAAVESLNDFPCRREGAVWRIAFGSLSAGQKLEPIFSVTLPAGEAGTSREVVVRVEDKDGSLGEASASVRFTWAAEAEVAREPGDGAVDRQAGALDAARAERDALERNGIGDFAGARNAIELAISRILEYAGDDLELRKVLSGLQDKAVLYARAIEPIASKTLHSISSQTLSGRMLEYARRRALQQAAEQGASSASGCLIVPSEWDVETAVEEALKRIAAATPALADLDASGLARCLSHADNRGCLLDPAVTREGTVELLFEAPGLCRGCHRKLGEAGVPNARITEIVEALRLLSAASGVVH
jgi:Ca-activated chloride channel family protein